MQACQVLRLASPNCFCPASGQAVVLTEKLDSFVKILGGQDSRFLSVEKNRLPPSHSGIESIR